jgi:enoyl-CoA hydratase/carnithine racemase
MSADGGSLRVTLCRAQVRNALDIDLVEALIEALDEAAARGVHSVILDAEGPAFCAGLDLGDMASRSDGDFLLLLVRIETLLQRVYRAPFQTLALAQGAAFGAGADLLAACRRRVATADLRIAFPGVRFGVFLGTRRLAARVGSTQAERILGDARTLNGAEALALGLVTDVAPPEDWDGIREQFVARGAALDPYVGRHLGDVLAAADDAEDMATLVRSASRPGLKQRIADYAAAARRR